MFPGLAHLLVHLQALSPAVLLAGVTLFVAVFFSVFKWTVWLVISFVLAMLQVSYGAYMGACIFVDLVVLSAVKSILWVHKFFYSFSLHSSSALDECRRLLWQAQTYREWSSRAGEIDRFGSDYDDWVNSDAGLPTAEKLRNCTIELQTARLNNDYKSLLFHLPGYVKRNHLGIDDIRLFTGSYTTTKKVITDYLDEVKSCAIYLRQLDDCILPISEKIGFFGKLSRNLGQSALCLSGGGALSMYHMGVIRALIESGNYSKVLKFVSSDRIPCNCCIFGFL